MSTECKSKQFEFHALGRREEVGRFDGGRISSDNGGLLQCEVGVRVGMVRRLGVCFVDHRNPESTEHPVQARMKGAVPNTYVSNVKGSWPPENTVDAGTDRLWQLYR